MGWIGLVFAGGRSRRMGEDKALVRIGGRTLLERAVGVVRDAGGTPIVVGPPRPEADLAGARQIDETGGSGTPEGPLLALGHGLRAAGPGAPTAALACDLPLVPPALLRRLVDLAPGWDAVVPRAAGELQVLAAVYDPVCLAAIDRRLACGDRALHPLVSEVRARIVEGDEISALGGDAIFLNVNAPEDLVRAEAALEAAGR